MIGRDKQLAELGRWLADLKENPAYTSPVCLLVGPPGTGKTTLANMVLREGGFEFTEVNASDTRSFSAIHDALLATGRKSIRGSMGGKPKHVALILEEVDGAFESDHNSIQALVQFCSARQKDALLGPVSYTPIIATCNEAHLRTMKSLLPFVQKIAFYPLFDSYAYKLVARAADAMGCRTMTQSHRSGIVRSAMGDPRQIIMGTVLHALRASYLHGPRPDSKDACLTPFQVATRVLEGRGTDVPEEQMSYFARAIVFQNYLSSCQTLDAAVDLSDAMSAMDIGFSGTRDASLALAFGQRGRVDVGRMAAVDAAFYDKRRHYSLPDDADDFVARSVLACGDE